jgi:integrase
MKLSDAGIKKAKAKDKSYKLTDGGGLYILIETTGGKLWRFDYRFEGKRRTLALGKYPDVSLQDARILHQEARKQLAQGINPAAAKKAQKAAGRERMTNSLETIAHEWLEVWKADKSEGHYKRVISSLRRDIFPYIGGRPVAGLTAPDVLSVCRRIEERGAIDTAHGAKGIISLIMRYAVATGRANIDPCMSLRGILKPVQGGQMASFTEPEKVGGLMRAIDNYRGGPVVRAALRLLPLVFTRPGELRMAKWADIDLDYAEWKYTASKTKTEHLVPLSRQAVEILRDLQPLTGNGEYVFPHMFRKGCVICVNTLNRALQDLGYDTRTEITGHGFRSMARTMLSERLRFPAEVIEHQLAHKVPDALGTAYNRTKFIDDRKRMMQVWSDYLTELKTANFSKVIPFERAV